MSETLIKSRKQHNMTPFIVGALPHTPWQPLEPLLLTLGWKADPKSPPENWLQQPASKQQQMVLFAHPTVALTQALRSGNTPEQALNQWLEHSQQALNTVRQQRKNTLLVNLEQAINNPQALISTVQKRLNLTLDQTIADYSKKNATQVADNTHYTEYLLAHYLFSTSKAAQNLLDVLEAHSTPLTDAALTDPEHNLPADTLFTAWQQQQQHTVQQLETLEQRWQTAQEELKHEKAELDQAKQDIKKAVLEQHETDEENVLLIEQLHSVQETLEQKWIESQTAQESLLAAQTELIKAQTELAEVKKEHTKAQQASKQERDELQKENQLILNQLFKVQEELQRHFLKLKNTESAFAEAKTELKQQRTEADRLRHAVSLARQNAQKHLQKRQKQQRSLLQRLGFKNKQQQTWAINLNTLQLANAVAEDWYLQAYPDVAISGITATEHYLKFGAAENRNPSPEFDTAWYLKEYPDVAESGLNPLLHYIKFGQAEGRKAKP